MTKKQKFAALALILPFYGMMIVRYIQQPRAGEVATSKAHPVGAQTDPGRFQRIGKFLDKWLSTDKKKPQ